jgi:hypothetical protein
LVDNQARVVDAQPLIKKLKETEYQVDYEYDSCQFEFRTPPTNMENIFELNMLFEQFIEDIDKTVQKVYRKMVYPVFLGANPSPQILREELITNKSRYAIKHIIFIYISLPFSYRESLLLFTIGGKILYSSFLYITYVKMLYKSYG